MKIYTKTGDGGKTSLGNKARVSKSHLRLECYGTFDELNSVIALALDHLALLNLTSAPFAKLATNLEAIQNELFSLGAELSLAQDKSSFAGGRAQRQLEEQIDEMTQGLPVLRNFVLPGGHILNSSLHLARTVCRRGERKMIALFEEEGWQEGPVAFVNRLSDWFFTAARFVNTQLGCPEIIWQPKPLNRPPQTEV